MPGSCCSASASRSSAAPPASRSWPPPACSRRRSTSSCTRSRRRSPSWAPSGCARRRAPLGGLARELPRTAAGFGVAVVTLAALPPLAGFVSEWFTLEALLQAFRLDNTVARLLLALGAALLALTAGLGLLAFAKLYGTVFLGQTRSLLGRLSEAR